MLGCFQLAVQVAVVMSWKLLKVSRSRAPWQPCTAAGSRWRSLQSLWISAEIRRGVPLLPRLEGRKVGRVTPTGIIRGQTP